MLAQTAAGAGCGVCDNRAAILESDCRAGDLHALFAALALICVDDAVLACICLDYVFNQCAGAFCNDDEGTGNLYCSVQSRLHSVQVKRVYNADTILADACRAYQSHKVYHRGRAAHKVFPCAGVLLMACHSRNGVIQNTCDDVCLRADNINQGVQSGVEERGVTDHAQSLAGISLHLQGLSQTDDGGKPCAHADGEIKAVQRCIYAERVTADIANGNDFLEVFADGVEEAAVRAACAEYGRAGRSFHRNIAGCFLFAAFERGTYDFRIQLTADGDFVLADAVKAQCTHCIL